MQEPSRAIAPVGKHAIVRCPENLPSHPVTGRRAGPQHIMTKPRQQTNEELHTLFWRICQSQKSFARQNYIPKSASTICMSIVYAVLLTSHFMYRFFFLHVCKSPQRSHANFTHRKFHHFVSHVQHQDTTKLLSQALIL